jgi:hypothetical protein
MTCERGFVGDPCQEADFSFMILRGLSSANGGMSILYSKAKRNTWQAWPIR